MDLESDLVTFLTTYLAAFFFDCYHVVQYCDNGENNV